METLIQTIKEKNENILRLFDMKEVIILKKIKPSTKTRKALNLPDDFYYFVYLDKKKQKLYCDCPGFIFNKNCKHIKYFEPILNMLKEKNGKNN